MAIQSRSISRANFEGGTCRVMYDYDDVTLRVVGIRMQVDGNPTPIHDVTCDQFNPAGQLVRSATLPNNQNGTFFDTNIAGQSILLDPFEKDGVTPRDPPRVLIDGNWGVRLSWQPRS